MKILSEVKYNGGNYEHDVLASSAVPYASIERLEEMFVRLDLRAIQVMLPQGAETLI